MIIRGFGPVLQIAVWPPLLLEFDGDEHLRRDIGCLVALYLDFVRTHIMLKDPNYIEEH